jgi:signal transduction histidine kinase
MNAGSQPDRESSAEEDADSGTTVTRLLVWILAGALVTAALAGGAIAVAGFAVSLQLGVGLAGALGGGFGAVGYLLSAGETVDTGEEMSVTMRDEADEADGSDVAGAASGPKADDLFSALPDPTVYFATEGDALVVRTANPAFEETFGVSPATLSGTPLSEALLTVDEDETDLRDRIAEGTLDTVVTCETVDGEREFRLRVVPLDDESTQGYLGYTDVSGEASRERHRVRADERVAEFASIVSHELRNPIDSARTRVNVAQETGEDVHFEKAIDGLTKMSRIIDDLVTLAREGTMVDDPAAMDLATVVDIAWGSVDAGGATLTTDDDLGTVYADEGPLQHLLENVFRNAVDHGGEDVTVHVGRLPHGFYVEDDGPGIPESDREHVFEPGFSKSRDGTGLGLRIVERVATAHGWSVAAVESEELGGARIEVTGVDRADG